MQEDDARNRLIPGLTPEQHHRQSVEHRRQQGRCQSQPASAAEPCRRVGRHDCDDTDETKQQSDHHRPCQPLLQQQRAEQRYEDRRREGVDEQLRQRHLAERVEEHQARAHHDGRAQCMVLQLLAIRPARLHDRENDARTSQPGDIAEIHDLERGELGRQALDDGIHHRQQQNAERGDGDGVAVGGQGITDRASEELKPSHDLSVLSSLEK